jgi:hypothetical protein
MVPALLAREPQTVAREFTGILQQNTDAMIGFYGGLTYKDNGDLDCAAGRQVNIGLTRKSMGRGPAFIVSMLVA